MERVSGKKIGAAIDQTMIAAGRIWTGTDGDVASSTSFLPGAQGGFTVQAWVMLRADSAADFIIATVDGGNAFTFSYTSAGDLQVQVGGKAYVATSRPTAGCWSNVAATVSAGGVQIFINGISVFTSMDAVGAFTAPKTSFGGWTATPGTVGSQAAAIQSISFFNGVLSATDLMSLMYARPVSDNRCIGFFMGCVDGTTPFNLVTGDSVIPSANAQLQRYWGPASNYNFPTPKVSTGTPTGRPLAKPSREQAEAYAAQALSKAGLGTAERQQATTRLVKDLRVGPQGDLVLVGQVLERTEGGLIRLDLVTSSGHLVELQGYAFPTDSSCAAWITKLLVTISFGFGSIIGHTTGGQSGRVTQWVQNFMDHNENLIALKVWIQGMLDREVTAQDVINGVKVIWNAGSFGWSMYDLFYGDDIYEVERATLSMMAIASAFIAPAEPPSRVWWAKVLLQLTSTVANVTAQLKVRPTDCPKPSRAGC